MSWWRKLFGGQSAKAKKGPAHIVIDFRAPEEIQAERDVAAGVDLGPKAEPLVEEVIKIGCGEGFLRPGASRDAFDENGRNKRACQLGEMLFSCGGLYLLAAAVERVRQAGEIVPAAQLEDIWGDFAFRKWEGPPPENAPPSPSEATATDKGLPSDPSSPAAPPS